MVATTSGDVRAASGHERGATAAEQAIERVPAIDGVASSDERVGDEPDGRRFGRSRPAPLASSASTSIAQPSDARRPAISCTRSTRARR